MYGYMALKFLSVRDDSILNEIWYNKDIKEYIRKHKWLFLVFKNLREELSLSLYINTMLDWLNILTVWTVYFNTSIFQWMHFLNLYN